MSATVNPIVYSSGVTIPNQASLATLCVFYDRVYLPHVKTQMEFFQAVDNVGVGKSSICEWDLEHLPLYRNGSLERLPLDGESNLDKLIARSIEEEGVTNEQSLRIIARAYKLQFKSIEDRLDKVEDILDKTSHLINQHCMIVHHLRSEVEYPEIFNNLSTNTTRGP